MKKRVLFLCTSNSARSQMAQALMGSQFGEYFEAYSAGTAPSQLDPSAVAVLERANIPVQDLVAKSVDLFRGESFDFLITLCDKARQECAAIPGVAETINWDIESPSSRTDSNPYQKTLHEIGERIRMFALVQKRKVD